MLGCSNQNFKSFDFICRRLVSSDHIKEGMKDDPVAIAFSMLCKFGHDNFNGLLLPSFKVPFIAEESNLVKMFKQVLASTRRPSKKIHAPIWSMVALKGSYLFDQNKNQHYLVLIAQLVERTTVNLDYSVHFDVQISPCRPKIGPI